ncbi:hypothetical protein BB561_001938 [Smittium simulii]|uniref:Importin N-terminal domain-containing protein n=1 Tax=Smittium simulii TaxID=133385 RepID=A0A2T9YSE8_9FUNG|nr:hypothetical protein BB561_001938 [Smittium simulii]
MNTRAPSDFQLESFDFDAFSQALAIPTEEALNILETIQKDKAGWDLAFRLLKTKDNSCMFFGAHTLRVKINKDWPTLEQAEKYQLKNELISLIKDVPQENNVVISKLCEAITAYQVQLSKETDAVSILEIVNLLAAAPELNNLENSNFSFFNNYVLEYLSTFPEEILRMDSSASKQNFRLLDDLQGSILKIFELLSQLILSNSTSDSSINNPILEKNHQRVWVALKFWTQLTNTQNESQLQAILALVQLSSDRLSQILESTQQNFDSFLSHSEVVSIIEFLEEVFSSYQIYKSNPQKMGELGLFRLLDDLQGSILKIFELLSQLILSNSTSDSSINNPILEKNHQRVWVALKFWTQLTNTQNESQLQAILALVQLSSDRLSQILESTQQNFDSFLSHSEVVSIIEFLEEVFSSYQIYKSNPQKMGELGLLCFSQPWAQQSIYLCLKNNDIGFPNQWASLINSYTELYINFCLKSLFDQRLKIHTITIWETMLKIVNSTGDNQDEFELSYHAINFWSILEEGWMDYQETLQDQENGNTEIESTKAVLENMFLQYVSQIFVKIQLPNLELWSDLDKESKEQFYTFRREVIDSILSSYRILEDKLLSELVNVLIQTWTSGDTEQILNWHSQEARLFIFRSISEEIISQPKASINYLLDQFFGIALGSNSNLFLELLKNDYYPQIFHTSIINIIGSYGEYLRDHTEFILGAVRCFTTVISNPKLVLCVTKSFKLFCEACAGPLKFYIQDLVVVATELLNTDMLDLKDINRVYGSVSSILSALEVPEKIKYGNQMIEKLINRLESELTHAIISPDQVEHYLSLISQVFNGLQSDENKESLALAGDFETIELFKAINYHFLSDVNLQAIKTRFYTVLQAIISSELLKYEGIYSTILTIINEATRKGPHPFSTDVDSILAMYAGIWNQMVTDIESTDFFALSKIFSSLAQVISAYPKNRLEWQTQEGLNLQATNEKITSLACVWLESITSMKNLCIQNKLTKFEEAPFLAEKVFKFLNVIVSQSPESFTLISFDVMVQIIMWSYTYYSGIDRLALTSAVQLMTSLILQITKAKKGLSERTEISEHVSQYYAKILETISASFILTVINSIAVNTPRSLIPNISILFLLFIKNNTDLARALLNEFLLGPNQLILPNVDQTDKSKFINSALGTRSVHQFKTVTNMFAVKVRGLAY